MKQHRFKLIAAAVAVAVALLLWNRSRATSSNSDSVRSTSAQLDTNPRTRTTEPITEAARGTLSGTITAAGKPIAGARVCARVSNRELSSSDTRFGVCDTTGADGRYTIGDLLRGSYRIYAAAAGFRGATRPQKREKLELEAGGHRIVDIELAGDAVEVRGVVVDIGGGPIAGASVYLSGSGWRRAAYLTVSSEDGSFVGWVPKGSVYASADAEGYTSARTNGIAPGQKLEILLTPESVIAGVVIDDKTEKPVAGARVRASGKRAISDREGRYRIVGLSPGRYKPEAETVGLFGEARESVLLGLGETVEGVEVRVHAAFVVTGTLLEPDGEPCEDGSVTLSNKGDGEGASGSTKDGGRVEIDAVFPGVYSIALRCRDFPNRPDAGEIEITGDLADQVWKLESDGASIAGRIVETGGKPLEGVSVRIQSTNKSGRGPRNWEWETTDEKGEFEARGLHPGEVSISVEPPAHKSLDPIQKTLEVGVTTRVDLEFEGGGVIEGFVRDQNGRPQTQIEVSARGDKRWSWNNRSQTLDDGSFRIEGIRPGTVRVTASGRGWRSLRAPGKSDDDVQGVEVEVAVGETASADLVVESRDGVIEGVVIAGGGPVSDAFLTADRISERAGARAENTKRWSRWQDWNSQPALTDTEGRFKIEDLSPGRYTVRAYRKGGGEGFADNVALGSDVEVHIRDTGSISGTVKVAGGVELEKLTASVHDETSGFRRRENFFRTGGAWALRDLPAGDYIVTVSSHLGTAKTEVTLAAGQQKSGVELSLTPRATIKGRVVALDDGTPVPGLTMFARTIKGSARTRGWGRGDDRSHITDADGRFELNDAPAGRISISGFSMNWETTRFGRVRHVVTAAAGETTDVGDIAVPRSKLGRREIGGDLGFTLADGIPNIEPEDAKLEVALVRSDGPAAQSGLVAGDVIVSVDGKDVRGVLSAHYYTFTHVPAGTVLKFGLARGASVEVTAAKPR